jgi:hypothetical protein
MLENGRSTVVAQQYEAQLGAVTRWSPDNRWGIDAVFQKKDIWREIRSPHEF